VHILWSDSVCRDTTPSHTSATVNISGYEDGQSRYAGGSQHVTITGTSNADNQPTQDNAFSGSKYRQEASQTGANQENAQQSPFRQEQGEHNVFNAQSEATTPYGTTQETQNQFAPQQNQHEYETTQKNDWKPNPTIAQDTYNQEQAVYTTHEPPKHEPPTYEPPPYDPAPTPSHTPTTVNISGYEDGQNRYAGGSQHVTISGTSNADNQASQDNPFSGSKFKQEAGKTGIDQENTQQSPFKNEHKEENVFNTKSEYSTPYGTTHENQNQFAPHLNQPTQETAQKTDWKQSTIHTPSTQEQSTSTYQEPPPYTPPTQTTVNISGYEDGQNRYSGGSQHVSSGTSQGKEDGSTAEAFSSKIRQDSIKTGINLEETQKSSFKHDHGTGSGFTNTKDGVSPFSNNQEAGNAFSPPRESEAKPGVNISGSEDGQKRYTGGSQHVDPASKQYTESKPTSDKYDGSDGSSSYGQYDRSEDTRYSYTGGKPAPDSYSRSNISHESQRSNINQETNYQGSIKQHQESASAFSKEKDGSTPYLLQQAGRKETDINNLGVFTEKRREYISNVRNAIKTNYEIDISQLKEDLYKSKDSAERDSISRRIESKEKEYKHEMETIAKDYKETTDTRKMIFKFEEQRQFLREQGFKIDKSDIELKYAALKDGELGGMGGIQGTGTRFQHKGKGDSQMKEGLLSLGKLKIEKDVADSGIGKDPKKDVMNDLLAGGRGAHGGLEGAALSAGLLRKLELDLGNDAHLDGQKHKNALRATLIDGKLFAGEKGLSTSLFYKGEKPLAIPGRTLDPKKAILANLTPSEMAAIGGLIAKKEEKPVHNPFMRGEKGNEVLKSLDAMASTQEGALRRAVIESNRNGLLGDGSEEKILSFSRNNEAIDITGNMYKDGGAIDVTKARGLGSALGRGVVRIGRFYLGGIASVFRFGGRQLYRHADHHLRRHEDDNIALEAVNRARDLPGQLRRARENASRVQRIMTSCHGTRCLTTRYAQ